MEHKFVLTLVGLGSMPKCNCLEGFAKYNFEKKPFQISRRHNFPKEKTFISKTILVIFLLNFQ